MIIGVAEINSFCKNNKRIALIFDTGVILADDLESFVTNTPQNVTAYIPWDCYKEIELISKYGNYDTLKRRAAKATELVRRGLIKCAWTLNEMVSAGGNLIRWFTQSKKTNDADEILFVFAETLTAEQMARRINALNGVKYIVISSFRSKAIYYSVPSGMRYTQPCRPLLIQTNEAVSYPANSRFEVESVKISFDELSQINRGGESNLYACGKLGDDRILKLYKFSLSNTMTDKLKCLQENYKNFQTCALPEKLVYLNGRCVGFTMRRIRGKTLMQYRGERHTLSETLTFIRKLFAVFLELRIIGIIPTDISQNNILIISSGAPVLIDCDSMQYGIYPGGGFTFPFGHPDITADFFYKKMRSIEHFNYSVAVLLWQLLLKWDNPYTQIGFNCQECSSLDCSFPFSETGAVAGLSVKDEMLREWTGRPRELRKAFCDTFTMRKSYDIGEWIAILDSSYPNQ